MVNYTPAPRRPSSEVAGIEQLRSALWRAGRTSLRQRDFRHLCSMRLPDPDFRRTAGGQGAGQASHRVLLGAITMAIGHFLMAFNVTFLRRAGVPDPGFGNVQGQYFEPGRKPLQARGPAPRGRVSNLLPRHQRRRDRQSAGGRHAGRNHGLALGFRRSRCRHGHRPDHLHCRAEVPPARTFRRRGEGRQGRTQGPDEPHRLARDHRPALAHPGAGGGNRTEQPDLQRLPRLGRPELRPLLGRGKAADDVAHHARRGSFRSASWPSLPASIAGGKPNGPSPTS